MKGDELITQEYLMSVLNYDENTGLFTRLIAKSRSCKVGDIAGCVKKDGYIAICIDRNVFPAHRLAWLYKYGKFPNKILDHINGNKADNRIENLREATTSQNGQNLRTATISNKSCGLLGVSWDKSRNKWVARIKLNSKSKHIGFFDDKYKAHEAYLNKKREIHEFCQI